MNDHAFSDLITRLEKATAPDRELDYEINIVVFTAHTLPAPHYTASIDAALTLVPEGFAWRLDHWRSATARVFLPERRYEQSHRHDGNSALALCIAALKARGK